MDLKCVEIMVEDTSKTSTIYPSMSQYVSVAVLTQCHLIDMCTTYLWRLYIACISVGLTCTGDQ